MSGVCVFRKSIDAQAHCVVRMVPRGRIELPTPAFSGPRSTDELPRHGDNQRFYGKGAGVERENERAVLAP